MSLDILASAYHLSRNTVDAERWTAEEWIKLARAYRECGWDLTPDRWAPWQVELCLAEDLTPEWDDNGTPIRPDPNREDTRASTRLVNMLLSLHANGESIPEWARSRIAIAYDLARDLF